MEAFLGVCYSARGLLSMLLYFLAEISLCLGVRGSEAQAQDMGRNLGQELVRVPIGGDSQSIVWSPDQGHVVVVVESGLSERRRIMSIDVARRSIDWSIDGQTTRGGKVAFLPGGSLLVTRSLAPINAEGLNWNLALSVLDAASGQIVQQVPVDLPRGRLSHRARDFALSEDGTSIAVLTTLPWVLGLDTRTWKSLWKIGPLRDQAGREISGKKVVLDSRRNRLSVATTELRGGDVQSWSLSGGGQLSSFQPYHSALSQMTEDFASGVLVTGGDGILHPYNTGDLSSFAGIEDDPEALVQAWDPSNGRRIATFLGPGRAVNGLTVSPGGQYVVASKSRDISPAPRAKSAHVLAWERTTAKLVMESNFAQSFPRGVAFSPDGRHLALEANQQLLIFKLSPTVFR